MSILLSALFIGMLEKCAKSAALSVPQTKKRAVEGSAFCTVYA